VAAPNDDETARCDDKVRLFRLDRER
jgi:hypothetical protein